MGAILAKFRKGKTTVEILEGIDKDIDGLLRSKRRNVELEKHYMGSLLLYSVIGYLIMALFFYFLYNATTWLQRVVQILPLLLFPFLIWLIRKALHWYFVKRIAKNDLALEELRNKKKTVLEDVKENESYKKAKEILEKFDPSATLPPLTPVQTPALGRGQTPTPALRQRPFSARGRGRGRGSPSMTPMRPSARLGNQPMLQSPQAAMIRSPGTVRPILSQEQTTFDKLVGYLVGDGPGSRYALICKHCYSHNGMALQEEYEYLAFRCAYCKTFNPSKKVRPNAPKLPETPAVAFGARLDPERRGSGSNASGSEFSGSETESTSSHQNQTEEPTTTMEPSAEVQSTEETPVKETIEKEEETIEDEAGDHIDVTESTTETPERNEAPEVEQLR
ncbi:endoplasmic reticulum junction formation protein lunapark-B-like isoform X2 [Strongylocentrotus purpuratus]|uniref:Endoplasmic reticulum junction formation protein lunapark n=1 Tax=Strongylocentrotus purpuratus TaxID=7668 RepID=A0A7M7MYZ2_STRPU|nr:endoplasmic reticulum junction formation protein lunapark-B isoform X2 [Strongylocentrotus purpuratus]XP_030828684.1 endoplasmic reticulum junction formation protein lunapark-B-like isoform X2 [Strongylocentrotus purpuratus]|eukprot:XP_011660728.1 PREDICTED: protein lunapark-B isoform X2 [Strongylocentrotus purpuratus]